MTCRGIVKGNVVVLDEDVHLPEGAVVEVRLLEGASLLGEPRPIGPVGPATKARIIETADPDREAAFARVLAQRAAFKGRRIGIDEIIEEDKQDREARVDGWLSGKS